MVRLRILPQKTIGNASVTSRFMKVLLPAILFILAPALAYVSYVSDWREVPWPHRYTQGDDLIYMTFAKNFAESWSLYRFDRLGAPFEYAAQDFPFFTLFNFVVIAAFDLIFKKIQYSVLAFHLFCIGVSAALMSVFLERLKLHRAINAVASLSFALTPYILTRNTGHLDYAVGILFPMFLILLHRAYQLDSGADKRAGLLMVWAFLFGVLATLQQFYHAFFLLIFLGALAVLLLLPRRSWRTLGVAGMMALGIAVSFAYFVVLFQWESNQELGRNLTYTQRTLKSLNFFSLLPTHLVLPQEFHRLRSISLVKQVLHAQMTGDGQTADIWTHSLGLFGTIGFLFLCFRAMTPFRLPSPYPLAAPGIARERLEMAAVLSLMTLAGVLFATPSGAATLFGFFVTPQMHGSQRISLPIACFATVGTAFLLQSLYEWRANRPRPIGLPPSIAGQQWMWIGAIAIGALIYADQTVDYRRRNYFSPENATAPARLQADRDYFQKLEAKLPKGAAVYIYPHSPWSGLMPWENMNLKPVIATDHLRWSAQPPYARQANNWSIELAHLGFDQQIARLRDKGFAAVLVNTTTYEVGRKHPHYPYPLALADFLAALGRESVEPPLVSADGQYEAFILPDHATAALKRNCEPYALGTRHNFNLEDRNFRYFDIGWAVPQPTGTWMARINGFPAYLRLCLDKPAARDLELELDITPHVHPASPVLQMDVIVNGATIQQREFKLAETPGRTTVKVVVPAAVAMKRPLLTIGFRYFRGGGNDIGPGAVGALLHGLTVTEAAPR
jgi:hypothetical protein